jgi:LacI family repressor for deo operon, udp, cdd, tsx, nupC, and nupG
LSNPEAVRDQTRKKVFEAARSLDFQVNRQAIDFRRGRSNTLIVLVSDISNPFYSEFFAAIEGEARRRGFTVLIGDTASDPHSEESYVNMLWAGKADGLISNIGRLPKGLPSPVGGRYAGPPIVACNHGAGTGIPIVRIGNYRAGKAVAQHLAGLGHRRFAQIHGDPQYDDYNRRLRGFLDGVAEAGFKPNEVMLYRGDQSIQSGRDAAAAFMSAPEPPTAVFAHSDEMAVGALHQLTTMGVRVPADVSLVGFDDLNYTAALTPPLTTMRIPRQLWGQTACSQLIDQIVSGRLEPTETAIPAEFILRASTALAPCRVAED